MLAQDFPAVANVNRSSIFFTGPPGVPVRGGSGEGRGGERVNGAHSAVPTSRSRRRAMLAPAVPARRHLQPPFVRIPWRLVANRQLLSRQSSWRTAARSWLNRSSFSASVTPDPRFCALYCLQTKSKAITDHIRPFGDGLPALTPWAAHAYRLLLHKIKHRLYARTCMPALACPRARFALSDRGCRFCTCRFCTCGFSHHIGQLAGIIDLLLSSPLGAA